LEKFWGKTGFWQQNKNNKFPKGQSAVKYQQPPLKIYALMLAEESR
jgi:hypothetical protein